MTLADIALNPVTVEFSTILSLLYSAQVTGSKVTGFVSLKRKQQPPHNNNGTKGCMLEIYFINLTNGIQKL